MNEDEKKLLEETARLTKENHKMLKSMHRKQTVGAIWSAIKWILIVLFTIWSWIILQPFIERMQTLATQVHETTQTVNGLKMQAEGAYDTSGLQDLFNAFRMGSQ
jgi:hypothetical protein